MEQESSKLENIVNVKNEIIRVIDTCQEVKRYCLYLTDNPLGDYGSLENGELIKQDNIETSMYGTNLIPNMDFNEMVDEEKVFVMVDLLEGNFSDTMSEHMLIIRIMCPRKLNNNLEGLGQERSVKIGQYITGLIGSKSFVVSGKLKIVKYKRDTITKHPDLICFTIYVSLTSASSDNIRGRRR